MFVSQIPRQFDEYVVKYTERFAFWRKVFDQAIDFGCNLFTGRERVNIPFRLIKRKALEVMQDFAPKEKSIVRVISPIQFARPFARLLIGT